MDAGRFVPEDGADVELGGDMASECRRGTLRYGLAFSIALAVRGIRLTNRVPPEEHYYRRVFLSAFEIDRHEVTVAQYRGCVAAGSCSISPLVSKAMCR